MSYKVTHICYCGKLDELEIPDELVEVKQLLNDRTLDKAGIEFDFLNIFKGDKEFKIYAVLDFNEPMPISDKVISCELRFNMGDHDIPIEEYTEYSRNVSSVIDHFADTLLNVFPQGDVKLMVTKNDDIPQRFFLCFYNTVDEDGEFLSETEINNTMAWDLALIFTECDLKITYLIESY